MYDIMKSVKLVRWPMVAAVGAGLTGSKMARRVGGVDEFEFKAIGENHNQGQFTHERISWNPTCRYSWDFENQGFGASKSKVSSYSSLFQRVLFLGDTLLHTYPFPPCYLFTFTLICLNFPFIYEK
ncbi:hypothetical protein GYH30_003061 [Glycine max]|nr:hypothetical protein GYH30_003061 [Glycine max]